jgi:hypothetical protein
VSFIPRTHSNLKFLNASAHKKIQKFKKFKKYNA